FSEYERVAKIENIPTVFLPSSKESGFFVSVQQLLPHITPGSMLILGNPASPAGTFLKKGELQGLIEACEQKGAWLIIDEAFIDFVPDSEKETQVQTSLTKKHLIIIRSFTKYFAIPGLRLGYMVANEGVTRKVSNFQPPWGVNAVSEFAGISILDSGEVNEERGKWLEKEQNYFMDAFTGSSRLRLYPSAVNFFLLELLEKKTNAPKVHSQLLKKGIIIRDCSNFRGLNDQFIRFCVRFREENRLLVESLKEVLGE
ncbi:MAG: pyridoxal phosphate-dependent aminotransferase, partial [Nitrospinota bacterium]